MVRSRLLRELRLQEAVAISITGCSMTLPSAGREAAAGRPRRRSFEPVMTLTGEGLVLGGTILVPLRDDRDGAPEIAIDGAEQRIVALLAVAYGKTARPGVLGNARRAARYWHRGENDLAAIEIALSGLPPLPDIEKASTRLLLGEQLLAEGLSPRELIRTSRASPPAIPTAANGPPKAATLRPPPSARAPARRHRPKTSHRVRRVGRSSGSTTLHGYATVYANDLKGRPTVTGEIYDPKKMTAAVLPGTIPLKSVVTVTLDSDPSRSVDVYVNDHGLYRRIPNPDGTFT